MRKEIPTVEIQEPPIRELGEKSSCVKRTCMIGCGSILLFILIVIVTTVYGGKPRAKELREVPDFVSKAVPLYDPKSIDRITFLSGSDRGRLIERIALLPKALFAPVLLFWEKESPEPAPLADRLTTLMKRPVTDRRDIVEIEWRDLSALPKFIQSSYEKSLKKEGFDIVIASETDTMRQATFTKTVARIDGLLFIRDDPSKNGTDVVHITLRIPSAK